MEVKKIVEGMTAQQVAQVIDDNFKNQNKILEEDIAKQNNVIGVSEYKDFSEAEAVNVGDVRKYNGFLYECVEATTGAFDASKWKKSSFKAETEKKLSELGSDIFSLCPSFKAISISLPIVGYYIDDTDGLQKPFDGNSCTDFLEIQPGYINFLNYGISTEDFIGYNKGLAFYDSNKKYISGHSWLISSSYEKKEENIRVPANARYIRLSTFYNAYNELYVNNGTVVTSKDLLNISGGEIELTPTNLIIGYYIDNTDGLQKPFNGNACTDFLEIQPKSFIKFNNAGILPADFIGYNKGLAFYDSNKKYISGHSWREVQQYEWQEEIIESPANAKYVRFSAMEYFSTFFAFEYIQSNIFSFNSLDWIPYSEQECLSRFMQAVYDKCTSLGIDGSTIVNPWGTISSYLDPYDICKFFAIALGYDKLNMVWCDTYHNIHTNKRVLQIESNIYTDPMVSQLTSYYSLMGQKSGESSTTRNIVAAVTCDALDGNVMVGFINTDPHTDPTISVNRYACFKTLCDIGIRKYLDKNADVSDLESALKSQSLISGAIILLPKANPMTMHHIDFKGSSKLNLYAYNPKLIQHFSTIKVLSSIIACDYITDWDEQIVIKNFDTYCEDVYGIQMIEGEVLTMRDLLYMVLMNSSNQATKAMAIRVGSKILKQYGNTSFGSIIR